MLYPEFQQIRYTNYLYIETIKSSQTLALKIFKTDDNKFVKDANSSKTNKTINSQNFFYILKLKTFYIIV